MNNINNIKRTFIRQTTEDSCGTACLAMLLNYLGRKEDAIKVNSKEVSKGGLSLLELREMADSVGLSCKCVEMEMAFLKTLNKPVILHTLNELGRHHFQICYGSFGKQNGNNFLMADPAIQVHYLEESELEKIWVSKAALYFDDLTFKGEANNPPLLMDLLRQRAYPPGLLVIIPLLSICIASFGIALTWLLQKGLTDSSIFHGYVIYGLVIMLFIICIFRNLFSFLRQYILIQINLSINSMLIDKLLTRVRSHGRNKPKDISNEISFAFVNVQHIQNAVSAFISILLSDGCMMVILLISSFYILPVAGVINSLYILTLIFMEIHKLPEVIYQASRIRFLSAASQKALITYAQQPNERDANDHDNLNFELFYGRNLQIAKKLAIDLSRRFLVSECLGTINLLLIMTFCVFRFETLLIDYGSVMLLIIETYLITALMQKICSCFQQLAEGADALIAYTR